MRDPSAAKDDGRLMCTKRLFSVDSHSIDLLEAGLIKAKNC